MLNKLQLQATNRNLIGRRVKNLRSEGVLPAVVYGHGFEPRNVQVDIKEFEAVYSKAGESTLVYIQLDKESYPTIISDIDRDPVTDEFRHVDFHKVRLDEKVTAMIPLIFEGESPAVKNLGGVLVTNLREIEVKGLPTNLPHEIKVDLSGLAEFEDHLTVKDLNIGDEIEITADTNDIVVLVQAPMSDEELEKSLEGETSDVADVEIEEKKKEEDVPAEGEAPKPEEKKE
jgi:large subunit ribosomal protein L25